MDIAAISETDATPTTVPSADELSDEAAELIAALAFEPRSPKLLDDCFRRQEPTTTDDDGAAKENTSQAEHADVCDEARAESSSATSTPESRFCRRPIALFLSPLIIIFAHYTTLSERLGFPRKVLYTVSLLLVFLAQPIVAIGWRKDGSRGFKRRTSNSLLTVSPSKIIEQMSKHGGLVLPPAVEQDLKVFHRVCKCDLSYLDVVKRVLEVHNLTLSPSSSRAGGLDPALRIKKVVLRWDSYRKPCVDFLVEDVELFVEYANLWLSKSNWDELKDEGFPPEMADDSEKDSEETKLEKNENEEEDCFVRIGSINLKGSLRLNLRSRPLDRPLISEVVFEFSTLEELMERIRSAGLEAEETKGLRGMSPKDLEALVGEYFKRKITETIKSFPQTFADADTSGKGSDEM